MATFSFDIISEYDKAEVNNVFAQIGREMSNRYDFKNTPAAIEWLGDKAGFKIIGASDWQIETILDIVRKALVHRNQSSKILDLTKPIVESNLKATKEVPFVEGLDQEKAKRISAIIREKHPKAKPQIQGDAVRVQSPSKDELQSIMQTMREQDFDFAISYTNYR
jgi:uncharacterized protein YajQ (UPF0234 family)